jgi:ribosomal protein L29
VGAKAVKNKMGSVSELKKEIKKLKKEVKKLKAKVAIDDLTKEQMIDMIWKKIRKIESDSESSESESDS